MQAGLAPPAAAAPAAPLSRHHLPLSNSRPPLLLLLLRRPSSCGRPTDAASTSTPRSALAASPAAPRAQGAGICCGSQQRSRRRPSSLRGLSVGIGIGMASAAELEAAAPANASGAPPPVLKVDPADLPPVVAGPGAGDDGEEEAGVVAGPAGAAAAAAAQASGDDPWWRLRYPLPEALRLNDDDDDDNHEDEKEEEQERQGGATAAAAAPNGASAPAPNTTPRPPPSDDDDTPSARAVRRAARLLRKGLPVALPTETVYGLACDATSTAAAARVFEAKGRPQDNPLIVHVSSLEMLLSLYPRQDGEEAEKQPAEDETEAEAVRRVLRPPNDALARAFWPGPLTLLLPASPRIPSAVTAGHATVAVRMPAHPVARAVIAAAGVPLAAPSANVSGRPSPTEAQHVASDFAAAGRGHLVPLVLDGGACACGVESTVAQGRGGWGVDEEVEEEAAAAAVATPGRSGGGSGGNGAAPAAPRPPPPSGPGRPEVVVLRPGGVTPAQIQAALLREYGDGGKKGAGVGVGGGVGGVSGGHPASSTPAVVVYGVSEGAARDAAFEAAPTTPGMKYRHYSPDAPVLLVEPPAALNGESDAEAEAEAEARWRRATADAVLGGAAKGLVVAAAADSKASGLTVVLLRTTLPPGAPEGWQQQEDDDPVAAAPASSSSPLALAAAGVARVLSYNLGSWRAPEAVARRLFAGLRAADAAAAEAGGPAVIVAEGVPCSAASAEGGAGAGAGGGVGVAVMNRLRKAAAGVVVAA